MMNRIELIAQANGYNPTEFSKKVEQCIFENGIKAQLRKQIVKTDDCMISKNIIHNPSGNNYKIKIEGKIPESRVSGVIDYISETNNVIYWVYENVSRTRTSKQD